MWHGQDNLVCQPSDNYFVSGSGDNLRVGRLIAAIIASGIVATSLIVTLSDASAKTKVEGALDAVSLTADNAPIGEVLAELSAKFGLIYTPTLGLDGTVGGTYSGTLQQVLARILDGCDYVVSYSGDKIELEILGRSGSTAHPSDNPSPTAPSVVVNAPPSAQVSAGTHPPHR